MVESCGADIVIEDVFEGVRDYWGGTRGDEDGEDAGDGGDALDALVRAHLVDRVPGGLHEVVHRSEAGTHLEAHLAGSR